MIDLEKVYSVVNTFMVSTAFFDILRRKLFFPEDISSIYKGAPQFIVCEVENEEEFKRMEALSQKTGTYLWDYLYVLRDGTEDHTVHGIMDFIPFRNLVLDAFETFAQDSIPLVFPEMWRTNGEKTFSDNVCKEVSHEFILEGSLILQLTMCSVPLSEFFAKARADQSVSVQKLMAAVR